MNIYINNMRKIIHFNDTNFAQHYTRFKANINYISNSERLYKPFIYAYAYMYAYVPM